MLDSINIVALYRPG